MNEQKEELIKELSTHNGRLTSENEHLFNQLSSQKTINTSLIADHETMLAEETQKNLSKEMIIKELTTQLTKLQAQCNADEEDSSSNTNTYNKNTKNKRPEHTPSTSHTTTTAKNARQKTQAVKTQQPLPSTLTAEASTLPTTTSTTPHQQQEPEQMDGNTPRAYKSILVLGDSQVRDFNIILKNFVPVDCKINVKCNPGFKINDLVQLAKKETVTSNTLICILGGSNDDFKTKQESIEKSLDELHKVLPKQDVLIVLIPPRYTARKINQHIASVNTRIKHYIKKYNNFTCLDPHNFLNITHLNQDMVHLNRKGKNILCRRMVNKSFGITKQEHKIPIEHEHHHSTKHLTNRNNHQNKFNTHHNKQYPLHKQNRYKAHTSHFTGNRYQGFNKYSNRHMGSTHVPTKVPSSTYYGPYSEYYEYEYPALRNHHNSRLYGDACMGYEGSIPPQYLPNTQCYCRQQNFPQTLTNLY
ncbi:hypothetical protein M8J77_004531 [Diaphorina citri]|nr:hypothetical protein M8J77_004531 [Diaphorina citri]